MTLDHQDVQRLLRMQDLIPAMTEALSNLSSGKAVQPVRVVVPVAEHRGFFGVMPAFAGALGAKLVTWYPDNQGVPTHHAIVQLFRSETGEPLVTMDGTLITEMRTGAVSAVATDWLARREASVLAVLGSGVQARSHLEALRLVRAFRDVRVWSPRTAGEFAAVHGVRAVSSAEEAVRGADVIVVATMSRVPVLARSRLFVESREAASRESGDVMASRSIVAEIGEVVTGAARGRETRDEITLFKSVGVAVEDVATANLVYRLATAATMPPPG